MPNTLLGRIADRAHEIMKYPQESSNEEVQAIGKKNQNINALKAQGEAQQGPAPVKMRPFAPSTADKLHPSDEYGTHAEEKRLDPQGNEITPTTPEGLGAAGPKRPVPTALGSLPSYDEGGDVPEDQVAKVHEGEKVLNPEEAAAYRQAESEVMNNAPLGHGEPAERDKANAPLGGRLDTEGPEPDKTTEQMSMDNFVGKPKMDISNPPRFDEGNSPIQEASTKSPLGVASPASSKMKSLPSIETPVQSGATDNPNVPQGDTAKNEASAAVAGYPAQHVDDKMAVVKKDQEEAMRKGDLVGLGMSKINERMLNAGKGAEPALPTPTAPAPEEGLKNEKEELRQKMLYAPTEQERFQAEKDLAELKRKTPWGSPENHPGILGKIGHAASSIGQGLAEGVAPYVLPAIPGSQANIAAQEARGESGVEQAQGKEMKAAQIATEQQKPELKEQAAELAQQKLENAQNALLRKQQLKVDAAGHQIPLTYEELTPQEQGAYDLQQAKSNAQNSIAALKQAQADPNSPASKLVLEKAKAEAKKLDIAAQRLGIESDKYKADYLGVDHDGNPLAGAQTTEEGKPVGVKVSKAEQSTTSMRLNKADLSQNVQLNAANAAKLIDANPELFGKVSGRYTNVREMAGTDDPAIVQLGIQIHNMAVASAGIHGQRGQAAVEAYEKDILNKFRNSPDATKAALNELSGSVQTFIDDARAGKKVAPTPKTTEEVTTGIPKDATHTYKNKDGKIVGYALGGRYHALETK